MRDLGYYTMHIIAIASYNYRYPDMTKFLCVYKINLQWLKDTFLSYLRDWEEKVKSLPLSRKEKVQRCLSRETLEGMKITGKTEAVVLSNDSLFNLIWPIVSKVYAN